MLNKKRFIICAVAAVIVLMTAVLALASCSSGCSHEWGEWRTVDEATCSNSGRQTRACGKCGAVDSQTVSPTGHSFGEYKPEKAPTCLDDGYKAHKECVSCGLCTDINGNRIYDVVLPALHAYGDPIGHGWEEADCTDPKRCYRCGITEGEPLGHSWLSPTCTSPKTCEVCKATEGEALGHTPVTDAEVPAQLGQSGLTAGSHCGVCGEVLVKQEIIPMLCGITVSSNNDSFGTVTAPASPVSAGSRQTVSAVANNGYKFFGWFDGNILVSTAAEYTFTVPEGNVALVARFTSQDTNPVLNGEYNQIFTSATVGGSVNIPDAIIRKGEAVRLVATAQAGYGFIGWFDGETLLSRDAEFVYTPDSSKNITAEFELIEYTADIDAGKGVTVSGNAASYHYGDTVTLRASVAEGYSFVGWYKDGILVSESLTYSFDITDFVTLSAVSRGDEFIIYTPDTSVRVEYGSDYTLEFGEKTGYAFVGYYTQPDGEGTRLTDEHGRSIAPYGTLENTTVYPYYSAKATSVTLNYNDGATENEEKTAVYDIYFTLPTPVRARYSFAGWYVGDTEITSGVWSRTDTRLVLTARWTPIPIADISVSGKTEFDFEGSKDITAAVSPSDAFYSNITYEIIAGADGTGAVIGGTTLTAQTPGDITVRFKAYGENGEEIFSKDIVITAYTTHIASLEITNSSTVVKQGESLQINVKAYPATAYPRGKYVYQLANNTCGASVDENGVLTVTGSGSVRVRVRVDDSDWSDYVWFNVPTPIYTAEQFNGIRNDLTGYYILMNDIDLSGYSAWQPIGYAENSDIGLTYGNAFKGYLDGNGFAVRGLNIDLSQTPYLTVGLFGAIDNSATVINLNIENYTVSGACADQTVYIGGLAGIVNGTVRGGSVSGVLDCVGGQYIGGAVGMLFGEFSGAEVDTEITAGGSNDNILRVGGAVGYYVNGKYEGCTVSSDINVFACYGYYVGVAAGEAEGRIEGVTVAESSVKAFGTQGTSYAGMYVGKTSYALLEGISVDGNISASSLGTLYVGGIAGYAVNVANSTFGGNFELQIANALYFGGIVGYASGDVSDCDYFGESIGITPVADTYFGGIAGYAGGSVRGCEASIPSVSVVTKGDLYLGGIVGYAQGGVETARFEGSISAEAAVAYVGGIAGYIGGNVESAEFDGNIGAQASTAYIGGISGSILGSAEGVTSVGDISAEAEKAHMGGIAGKISGDIKEAYYQGNITLDSEGEAYVGGIVGEGAGVLDGKAYSIINIAQNAGHLYIGGISGKASGEIADAYFFGYINSSSVGYGGSQTTVYNNYIGGIAGYTSQKIESSISNAKISITNAYLKNLRAGGIAGYSSSLISDCKSDGTVNAYNEYTSYLGGIAGDGNDVSQSYSVGDLTASVKGNYTLYVGGITGSQRGSVSECYYSFGDIYGMSEGTVYSGGISGEAKGNTDNSYSSYSYIVTDMSKTGSDAYLGGIAGYNSGVISNCYSMNYIDGKADGASRALYIGGLAGYNAGTVRASHTESATYEYIRPELADARLCDIETTALNSAEVYAGGLVGYNAAGAVVRDGYSENQLQTRNSYTGGIVGRNAGSVESCISRAQIHAVLGEKVGGFAGIADEGSVFANCYFSTDIESAPIGTGSSDGIEGKTNAELKGTAIYADYDKSVWSVIFGKFPELIYGESVWAETEYGYLYLVNLLNAKDQHDYDIPKSYCKIDFNVGLGEYPVESVYVYGGESVFIVTEAQRIGYIFKGWYYDEDFTECASNRIVTFYNDTTLYAKWEAIPYGLTVSVDGKGSVNLTEKEYIYKDTITLTTDDIPLDYAFIGWYEGDTLLSADKTYTFSGPARDLSITAKFLTYYDLKAEPNSEAFGSVTCESESGRGAQTREYTMTAVANGGYSFAGWFDGDVLVSTDLTYTFAMPSRDYTLTARFTAQDNLGTDVWDGSIASGFAGGSGTQDDPYLISTGAQLAFLAQKINGSSSNSYYNKYYRLVRNIDLNGLEWEPIGCYYYGTNGGSSAALSFRGHFDGNGFKISNLKITRSGYYDRYVGLFGYINGGTVENLTLENITVNSSGERAFYENYVGGIAGYSNGTVRNCHVYGNISAEASDIFCGGIAGGNNGVIEGCSADIIIDSKFSAGGIAGDNDYKIINCIAYGSITSYYRYAGGIVGNNGGTVESCYAGASVASSNYYAGGIAGYNESTGAVYRCVSVSESIVGSASYRSGGIVGTNSGTVTDCYRLMSAGVSVGTVCTPEQLDSAQFYTETLGWSAEIWELSSLDLENGKFVRLKTDDSYNTYYQIFVNASTGGSVNINEIILRKDHGSVTLTAAAETGYEFLGWYIGGVRISEGAVLDNYKPDGSVTLTARFALIDYTLTAESSYPSIAVGGSGVYNYGNTVTLSASETSGYRFDGWYIGEERISTSLTCNVSMPAEDTLVTARYLKYFSVTAAVNSSEFGSAESSLVSAYETQSVTVTAEAKNGYRFVGWFDGDTLIATDLVYTFDMPSGDYVPTARFTVQQTVGTDMWDGSIADGFAGGSGTKDDPYLIANGAQLALLAQKINQTSNKYYDKYYKLTNDIDLGGREWTPIGSYYYSETSGNSSNQCTFQGYFDGNGYTVSNYRITSPEKTYSYYYLGLFGRIYGGTVENLSVTGAVIAYNPTESRSGNIYAGGIAGWLKGTISNCYCEAVIELHYGGESRYAGGIVGYASEGTVSNCYAAGSVSVMGGYAFAGGIVGELSPVSRVENCYSASEVIASNSNSSFAGGIAGHSSSSENEIVNCIAVGNVTSKGKYDDSSYIGNIVGLGSYTVTNCYHCEGQILTKFDAVVTDGTNSTACMAEQLNSAELYTETLLWSADIWDLSRLDFENGVMPSLKREPQGVTVGREYYQVFVEAELTNGSAGSVNVSEHIVESGKGIYLIASAGEGFELVGWFADGILLSEDAVFFLKPDSSLVVKAEFDVIRYSVLAQTEDGAALENYVKRNYEGDTVTLTAKIADGYAFEGWYTLVRAEGTLSEYTIGELVTGELTYSFAMPANTLSFIAVTTPIDYTLTLNEQLDGAGDAKAEQTVYNVGDSVTVNYTVNAGYRFTGWYLDGALVSQVAKYTFTAPADSLDLEARAQLITYTLSVSSDPNGSVNTSGGEYNVTDEITLTATPHDTYDFIGWYYAAGGVYSYESVITFNMPARDLSLVAKYELGEVIVTVVAGFNGYAEGSTELLKGGTATVSASANEGYRFVGWYLNGALVSTSDIYTAVYDVSGEYTLYAEFDENGAVVTYHEDNGSEPYSERIEDPTTYLFPYAYREGFRFDGWYLDKGEWSIPLTADITENCDAYAKWTAIENVTEMYKELPLPYSFEVYSRLDLAAASLDGKIAIFDANGNPIAPVITAGEQRGYYTVSADFSDGTTYRVEILDSRVFALSSQREFALSFARDEVDLVEYNEGVVLLEASEITGATDTGVILNTSKTLNAGNLIFCPDGDAQCVGYIESVIALGGGSYEIVFSDREIGSSDIFKSINVKQNDVEISLDGAEVSGGDIEEINEAFAEAAMEASSVRMFMNRLSAFAEQNKSFIFEEPKFDPKPSSKWEGNKITLTVTIVVNGRRVDSAGETLDEFKLKLVVTFINELEASSDVSISGLSINRFELEVANTTTISFDLDLIYANKGAASDFEALQKLLKDYETEVNESGEATVPFDTSSKYEKTFEAFTLSTDIKLGTTGLILKISVTPFMSYQVIGQIDVGMSFSVKNTCTVAYVNGEFDIYRNAETTKDIHLYALAKVHFEVGVDMEAKVYFIGLEDYLHATVNLKVGPYVEAAGVLFFEQNNDGTAADLAGYVEFGYFYDWDFEAKLVFKEFKPNIKKVYKPIGEAGTYYLYLSFENEEDNYVVEQYSVELFDSLDHSVNAFDLKNLTNRSDMVADEKEYRYEIEENPYLYIDAFNRLRVKQIPSYPVEIELYICVGNAAVKTVVLTVEVNQYSVTTVQDGLGTLKASKSYAMVGESVAFTYDADFSYLLEKGEYVVPRGWIVNGEFIDHPYYSITVDMAEGGITVQLVSEHLYGVKTVSSISDLNAIRGDLDGIYVQTADIDMGSTTWFPINNFCGKYYGNGYAIRNADLRMSLYNNDYAGYIGLFGYVYDATLHGIRMEDAEAFYVGYVKSGAEHCRIIGGGIVGYMDRTHIYGCSVDGLSVYIDNYSYADQYSLFVKRYIWFGGIVGFARQDCVIDSCSAVDLDVSAYVETEDKLYSEDIYGIIREFLDDVFDNDDSMERCIVGGIVGESYYGITVTDCYVQGALDVNIANKATDSKLFVGGIAGLITNNVTSQRTYKVYIDDCLADFTTTKTHNGKTNYVSAFANFGSGNGKELDSLLNESADDIFYVTDRYTASEASLWDGAGDGYGEALVYTGDFVYDTLELDSMLWIIVDQRIYFNSDSLR